MTTIGGLEVKLQPTSQTQTQRIQTGIEKRWRERGEPVDPPTYTATTATGETETYTHDETSLTTDKDRTAWAVYQDALARMTAEINLRVTQYLLLQGVVGCEPTPEWAEEQTWYGVEAPEDPRERRMLYLETEILRTPEDITTAVREIMKLSYSGASQEAIDAIDRLFRRTVERAADTDDSVAEGTVEL